MHCLSKSRLCLNPNKLSKYVALLYSTVTHNQLPVDIREICYAVSSTVGGLDELESSLNKFESCLRPSLVSQVIDRCKHEVPTRRLLRFFLWSRKKLASDIKDEDFNYVIRVLAEKKDHIALEILVSDLRKEGRLMEAQTFGVLARSLVQLGKADEALGIFKNLDKFKCPQDGVAVTAIVSALCVKGLARKALGVVWHHKDKISGNEACIYGNILYAWSLQENVKEARKIIKEMKALEVIPDLVCYNTFLKGLCERNLKRNPSGLLPEALNVMMEMRTYRIEPNVISYNILLSCLGRARRVKESCNVLESMRNTTCAPDWVSYYLVTKVLYLTGRFGKGNKIVDMMIEEGILPQCKFYYDLIGVLCGVERVNYAIELFERMKRSSLGGYGPVYDVLIPKLCRGGNFENGRELWDEAKAMGITLSCSKDVLDPSVTEVFKPTRKVKEKVNLKDFSTSKRFRPRTIIKMAKEKVNKKLIGKKKKRKSAST